MVKKEINVLKSKPERILLRNCIVMGECNSQNYKFLFSDEFDITVSLKTAMGYFLPQWSSWNKGNILRRKLERSFHRNFLVMCEFNSQSYTYVSCSSPLSLFLRNQGRTSLHRIEAYADKGNIISSKRGRIFLRYFFLICEFLSQSYCWVLRKQFANSLFMESAKWDLGAARDPWWKRKYPQIITGEKLTEWLLPGVWIHHTEFHPSLLGTVC